MGAQPNVPLPRNTNGRTKSAINMMNVNVMHLAMYLPLFCSGITRETVGGSISAFYTMNIGTALILLNSAINPLLCCYFLRDLRNEMKATISNIISEIRHCF
jgi:hypothetical protein